MAHTDLAKYYGCPESAISFSNNESPDLIAPDGAGYEVKRLNGRSISVDARQWNSLLALEECYIIVYTQDNKPHAVIPMCELPFGTQQWHDIRIAMTDMGKGVETWAEYITRVSGYKPARRAYSSRF